MEVYPSGMSEVEVSINGRTFRETVYPTSFGSLVTERDALRIVDQMWHHIGEPASDTWEGSSLDLMETVELAVMEVINRYDALVKDFGAEGYTEGQP